MKQFLRIFLLILAIGLHTETASQTTKRIEFVEIPGGEFSFNNSYYYKFHPKAVSPTEDKTIKVKISPFTISKLPITREEWGSIMSKDKFAPWERENLPPCPSCYADGVSYLEVQEFMKRLSLKESGNKNYFRLPTESEMIYLITSTTSPARLVGLGSSLFVEISPPYKNKFGILIDDEMMKAYIWTDDYAWNNYLDEFLNTGEKPSLPIVDPIPHPNKRFDYGKILFNFSLSDSYLTINRTGHSINMLPSMVITNFRIIKKKEK